MPATSEKPLTFETAPDVLTMREAMTLLRSSREGIMAMVERGTIPALHSTRNGRWLFPKAGLYAALMGGQMARDGMKTGR